MTEAAMSFNETVAERSRQKNSAFHKKNGSAVAKLGNKPMSWQEINSKHGVCKNFDLNGFPSYSEFVEFPNDLKVEYINKLMDKYDIDLQHISRYLFNKGDDGIRSYLRNNKLLKLCNYQKPRAKTGLLQFQSDIEEWRRREKAAKITDGAEAKRKRDIIWNAEFITYAEFKTLPPDGQVNYINNIIKKYSVSLNAIAQRLFRTDQAGFREHFKRLKIYDQIEKTRTGNNISGKKHIAEFDNAIRAWRGEEPMSEKVEETKVEEVKAAVVEETKEPVVEPVHEVESPIEYSAFEPEPVVSSLNSEMTFSANYISENGLDEQWFHALTSLFQNKKVKVQLTVEVVES